MGKAPSLTSYSNLRAEKGLRLSYVSSFKPGLDHNTDFHASLTVRNSTFLNFCLTGLFNRIWPHSSSNVRWRVTLTVNRTFARDLRNCVSPWYDPRGGMNVRHTETVVGHFRHMRQTTDPLFGARAFPQSHSHETAIIFREVDDFVWWSDRGHRGRVCSVTRRHPDTHPAIKEKQSGSLVVLCNKDPFRQVWPFGMAYATSPSLACAPRGHLLKSCSLSPFLTGRTFVREHSWEYSTNTSIVGS